MSYIGNPVVSTDFPKDTFSGNGSTTAFTLSVAPASVNAVIVIVSGVTQDPSTYTISGTTLTFSAAPPSGTSNISVRHLGIAGIPNTPSAASVVTTSIAANAVTPAKMANGGFEFGMRNRIINGAMVIDQRNAGAAVTVNSTPNTFLVDRWFANGESADGVFTGQQSTTAPVGFNNSLKFTVTTADASIGATQGYTFRQRIEGYNFADLGWGTANAKTITVSFWVQSSVTGTFGGSLFNINGDRVYVFSYSISAANTWEYKTVTIAGDTTGTWNTTNGTGLNLTFSLGVGSSNKGAAGSWGSTFYFAPTGSVDLISTLSATFYITGVQLEKGTTATEFDYRPYGAELQLCQRYTRTFGDGISGIASSAAIVMFNYAFEQPMRASPTVSITDTSIQVSNQFANDFTSSGSTILASNISSVGGRVNATGFTGLTQGVYYSAFGNTNGSFFLLSAEL